MLFCTPVACLLPLPSFSQKSDPHRPPGSLSLAGFMGFMGPEDGPLPPLKGSEVWAPNSSRVDKGV